MGFDNECILNIQSLAGEYFCPVCRTLVYPHEALQTQCTHLYCKPCLSYVVSSTQACPYDGYLVTEAGSKPLIESNKGLAETIGKTTVHCLYHRSGCVWQGPLSECTTHCSGCAFGNSPVVCNRCGIQIVHRQVQEHAQTCNASGTNTQPQGSAATSGVVSTDQSKIAPVTLQPIVTSQHQNQPATASVVPQAMSAPAVQTSEQQYYQQYQQYYQQYPGYDPYQQQAYQQYYPYQQPPAQHVQQPPVQPQSQPQLQQQVQPPLPPVQSHALNHPTAQAQSQGQGQVQPQTHPQAPANAQAQPVYPQPVVVGSSQNQGHMPLQSYSQMQPQLVQIHAQPPMQAPQYQPPHPQIQPPQVQPQPQPQLYQQPPPHFQPPLPPQPQSQPINPQHTPLGHPPYPSQPHQQIQHAPPQQNPMQVQPQPPSGSFPPPPPSHMRPPQPPHMLPPQQRPVMHPVQQPMPPQYTQQPQPFPGQTPSQPQGQPHHTGPYPHQQIQVRPQAPPQPMQQPSIGFVQLQQGNALPHGMPPQSYTGRPSMLPQGGQPPQYPQSSGPPGNPPPLRPPQFGSDQQHNQYAPPSGGEHPFERRVEPQEDKSPSLKKSEPLVNDFGPNSNEAKPEARLNDEIKSEDGWRKDEALIKDAVPELHQVKGDSGTTQRVKEELEDRSQGHHLSFSQSQTPPQGPELRKSPHPPVPYGLPGQQQRPVAPMLQSPPNTEPTMGQSPSHLKPHGHGYLSHGPHPGEPFQPPGPNQPRPVHPEGSSGGPNSSARGYEPSPGHGRFSRMSQGDHLGPPPPHGPDSQRDPRHPGPMESDMYPHSDNRHQDSRLPNSMRMNGVAPSGHDMPPTRYHEESFKQFHGPPHMGRENSPNFRSHLSRPSSGYGMDGPPRFHDKDPHGYGYDDRGGFNNNRHNPDFHGPMHGFGRRHMDRFPPTSPGHPFGGPHSMERQPFGERFPIGPPGHMHRGEFDGPGKPMNGEPFGPRNLSGRGEPGFGPFHDYDRSRGFSHHPRFGEPFGHNSNRPHLEEPGFRGSYSHLGGSFEGGFDPIRKSGSFSMGWCRICKVDCGSVEGLEVHGQTRDHQRMSMDMVISIKKNAKRQKSSIDREDAGKFRNSEIYARGDMS